MIPLQPIYLRLLKMNKTKLICAALALSAAATASAGGILTNTNQNIAFLRNPAQDAVIGIAGVYSNPAGVAFMNNGFHLSLNIQNAHQTREITSTFAPFAYGAKNFGNTTKTFKGEANAPNHTVDTGGIQQEQLELPV